MIYKLSTAIAVAYAASAYGYAPAATVKPFSASAARASAASAARVAAANMNAPGGTETVDFTAGSVRPQRDVTDEQMRPRPSIDWSNLRARLEVVFGIEDMSKYDDLSQEDLLKA